LLLLLLLLLPFVLALFLWRREEDTSIRLASDPRPPLPPLVVLPLLLPVTYLLPPSPRSLISSRRDCRQQNRPSKMPGSSRMPISLRDGISSVKKSRAGAAIQFLNIDL
jgi:hypothetical protein